MTDFASTPPASSKTSIDKRLVILGIMLVILAAFFWLSSRYPALNTKALMGESVQLGDGLSFDTLLTAETSGDKLRAVGVTFVNWLDTNKKGMTFGLSFAIVLLAMFPLLKPVFRGGLTGLRASFMGTVMGAPLGVCVNCAAPIAYGLYRGGARAETVLATMISSPTLNVIILSMTLTLLPFYIALTKIGLTFVLLLVVIPLLVRFFPAEAQMVSLKESGKIEAEQLDVAPTTWLGAIVAVLRSLGNAARQVLIGTLPLMLLAGLLGAVAITLIPWDVLLDSLPLNGKKMILLAMIGLALFGLFLPVPIAFDVIVVVMLLGAGLETKYAGTLLFVLGSFSIYSWLVLFRAGAVKLATALGLSIAVLGVFAGAASHYWGELNADYLKQKVYSRLIQENVQIQEITPIVPDQDAAFVARPLLMVPQGEKPNVEVAQLRDSGDQGYSEFKMVEKSVGFQDHRVPFRHYLGLPFSYSTALAAEDINRDGNMDVLVNNLSGAYLYMNTGEGFRHVALNPLALPVEAVVTTVAFADLNSDGFGDLIYAVQDEAVYYALNRNGAFAERTKLTELEARYSFALGFADVDRNGELDVFIGRHNFGNLRHAMDPSSKDQLFLQKQGTFEQADLPSVVSETLTVLMTDLNEDGYIDRLHGSEFVNLDNMYWGRDNKQWQEMQKQSVSLRTATTMSIDSADINNDLKTDFYQAQITANPPSPPAVIDQISLDDRARQVCATADQLLCNELQFRRAMRPNGLNTCFELDESLQEDCIAFTLYAFPLNQTKSRDPEKFLVKHYNKLYDTRYRYFEQRKGQPRGPRNMPQGDDVPFDLTNNLMHVQSDDGVFREAGKEMGVAVGGWSWNAQFADLDGDGFQDLFVVNGVSEEGFDTENLWFRNVAGQRFQNDAAKVGLNDMRITMSSLQFDADNDGDLDVLTHAPSGELTYYENVGNKNNHIQIELISDSTVVGTKIVLHVADGTKQIREVKKSGGYQSSLPKLQHFGLGNQSVVSSIELRKPNGETIVLDGNFQSGNRYLINM